MTDSLRQPLLPFSPSPLLPFASSPLGTDESQRLSDRTARQWIWFFLILGVAARLIRYALRFPLWEDEAFLSANFLHRGLLELTGSLDYFQVCPMGFLWLQWAVVKVLGFSEYSLRLVPLVCGIGSLFLFRHVAARFLNGTALVLAVAILSVAYPCIRYAAEAKQYGVELFVSLVLLTLAVEWWRRPEKIIWLWALAAAAPVAVWLCYPAVFVGAAVSLFVGWILWTEGRMQNAKCRMQNVKCDVHNAKRGIVRRSYFCILHFAFCTLHYLRHPPRRVLAWLAFNLSLAVAVLALYFVSARHQAGRSSETMERAWARAFPPVTKPLALLGWLADAHTGDLLAYPVGGRNGGSTVTLVLCTAAVIFLVRRRRWAILALWLGPLALSLAAAMAHSYPYGRMAKFQFFWAGAFCLLAGLGAAVLIGVAWPCLRGHVGRNPWHADDERGHGAGCRRLILIPQRSALIPLLLLAAIGLGSIGRDLVYPAKSSAAMRARDFARWFWFTAGYDGEVACLRTDLGETFSPGTFEWGLSAMYLCNQRIYSPRHARGEPVAWERVSADWPLRCVEYHGSEFPYDQAANDRWLRSMQSHYRLVGRERYAFAQVNDRRQAVRDLDYVEVYKFVPESTPIVQWSLSKP